MQNYRFSALAKYLFMGVLSIVFIACSENSSSASEEFDAAKVCPESGRGTFIDERDGQEYKYTTIGSQVWMAENLNYKTSYSMKHEGEYIDCSECGLWYNLGINLPKRDIIDSVCPLGWRVPTEKDWNILLDTIGRVSEALEVLLSETWSDNKEFQGSNQCGFSLKESGYIKKDKKETYYGDKGTLFYNSKKKRIEKMESEESDKSVLTEFTYDAENNLKTMSVYVSTQGVETKILTEILKLRHSRDFPDKLFEFT